MAKEIVLDVHELQPPAPMEQALEAIDKLVEGEYIKIIHRMQPFPLYNILFDNGFKHLVKDGTVSTYDIYIWRAIDKEAEEAVKAI